MLRQPIDHSGSHILSINPDMVKSGLHRRPKRYAGLGRWLDAKPDFLGALGSQRTATLVLTQAEGNSSKLTTADSSPAIGT